MVGASIIIPSFNNGTYIAESIDSVLQQTYGNFEIIVIDDGSTDDSGGIIEQYAERYPGVVRFFRQQNRGPGAARNTGLRNARGIYIAFNDADDLWLPQKLEKQVAVLDRDSNIGAVYCDNYYVDEQRRILPERKSKQRLPRGRITMDLFYRYCIYTSSILVRRSVIEKTGFFREDIFVGEDYHYFLRLSYNCEIDLVDEKLVEKRVLSESLSNQDEMLNAANDLIIFRDFLKEHPEFYALHRAELVERLHIYNFEVGYKWLKMGRNLQSMYYLLNALKYRWSLRTVKCLLLTLFPYDFVRAVKEKVFKRVEPEDTETPEAE